MIDFLNKCEVGFLENDTSGEILKSNILQQFLYPNEILHLYPISNHIYDKGFKEILETRKYDPKRNNCLVMSLLEQYDARIEYIEHKPDLQKTFLPFSDHLNQQIKNISYNSHYTKINLGTIDQDMITLHAQTAVTAENIAHFAYPLAQFVDLVKPDFIIACDRGARLIGLALHMMYSRLYGPLPTKDHSIQFRKISRKSPSDAVREMLRVDINRMLAIDPSPRVLVLDDWVNTGGTKSLVKELFAEFSGNQACVFYGVMSGNGADVTGNSSVTDFCEWHDRAELIGVDYQENSLQPSKVNSKAALNYRRRISEGIAQFVHNLSAP